VTAVDRDSRVAELVGAISDYRDGSPSQLRLVADALRDEFAAGYALGRRASLDESDVAAGLTSATARLIGLSKRDRRLEAIDHGVVFLTEIVNRLDGFAGICGSDTGAEGIVVVLREMVGYLKARDYDGASAALTRRLAAGARAGARQVVVERLARDVVAAEDAVAEVADGDGATASAVDRRCEAAWAALREALGVECVSNT